MGRHEIRFGDARKEIRRIPDASVQLVVTSPPYWRIKDYGMAGQVGVEQTYRHYIGALGKILRESWRVLEPGCRCVFNVGDQFLRARDFGRYSVAPIQSDLVRAGQKAGFDFMGNIIWTKVTTTRTTGGCSMMGSIYHPRDPHITFEHEYIVLFKKQGKARKPTREQKEKSRLTLGERSEWGRGIWRVPPERQKGHAAMFPVEIPKRLIRLYTFFGETVLDPFLGSGTTTRAAMETGRNSIGIELNPDFFLVMGEKLGFDASGAEGQAPNAVTLKVGTEVFRIVSKNGFFRSPTGPDPVNKKKRGRKRRP